MNVVIYSRVSSQTARQSTERQVTELRKFAIDRDYTVCTVTVQYCSIVWSIVPIRKTRWICCSLPKSHALAVLRWNC